MPRAKFKNTNGATDKIPFIDTIYTAALWLARDKTKAENLVADIYLRALSGNNEAILKAGGMKLSFKIMIDLFFSNMSNNPYQNDRPNNGDNGGYRENDLVCRAFSNLPVDIRIMMIMLLLGGLSYSEIADIFGIRYKTVELMIYRGHKSLQKELASLENIYDNRRGTARRPKIILAPADYNWQIDEAS